MYTLEIRKKARDLFVESGMSYEDVSRETRVSVQNLKTWGVNNKWMRQRREFRSASDSRAKQIQKLEDLIIDALIADLENKKLHSQDAYALAAVWRSLLLHGIVTDSPHLVKVVERLERILNLGEKLKASARK